MKVLVLGKIGSPLTPIIRGNHCEVIESISPVNEEFLQRNAIDFIVVYGYRHIIKKPVIDHLKGRVVNLHISLLPWNRGADPNLWSFLEDTPKGVTIHYVDEGLDTGDIIAQKELSFDDDHETLATTYEKLSFEIVDLFEQHWPHILFGKAQGQNQPLGGSYHMLKEKKKFEYLLAERAWDTPVKNLVGKALKNYPKK
jgi:methionyl-tRNA formyltransferase